LALKNVLRTLSLLVIFVPVITQAQWQRIITGDASSDNPDHPAAHPLAYFTRQPFLRAYENSVCNSHDPADCANNYKAKVSVRTVGIIEGFEILELTYTFTPQKDPDNDLPQIWKSLLVKTGEGSYREIFHLQDYAQSHLTDPPKFEPSRIVRIGTEPVLMTRDSNGGNGGDCYEGYWWFDREGPHALDFAPMTAAISKKIPADAIFTSTCWALNLDRGELKSWVQKRDAKCHACGGLGEVTADLTLHNAQVEATNIHFQPDTEKP
jgi:hypothetical protein